MPTPTAATPSNLVNSAPVEVTLLNGKKETVHFRRLSLRELYVFAEHARNKQTPSLVALCFDQQPEWVDTLTDETFGHLTDLCVALNFKRAMKIAERDPVMAMLIGPMVATGIIGMMEMSVRTPPPVGAPTSDSSPAPAPSESAEESGSASLTSPPSA